MNKYMEEHRMEVLAERIDELRDKEELTEDEREELLDDEEFLDDLRRLRYWYND